MYARDIPTRFLVPSLQSLTPHQFLLWSIVTEGQRASTPSCHVTLCQWRCASGSADSWSVCGENGEWRVVTVGAVTKCSSQDLPKDQSTAFILRLLETQQRNPPLYRHRAWHMCISDVKRHSLKNTTFTGCEWEEQSDNNTSMKWGHRTDIKQARVASLQITVKRRERFLNSPFLNYLLFSKGDDGLCLRRKLLVDS